MKYKFRRATSDQILDLMLDKYMLHRQGMMVFIRRSS